MPQPTPSDAHVNAPLSTISIAYLQSAADYISTAVFPVVGSPNQSNRYYTYKKGDWFRSAAQKRPPGTESAGSGYNVDNTPSFYCDVYAVHRDVDDQLRANQDSVLNVDREATIFVTQQLALRREIDWCGAYFVTGVWGRELTPSTLWSSPGSTPIKDMRTEIFTMKELTGYRPNTLTLGARVWACLQDHPDFLDRVQFGYPGSPSQVSPQLLAAILEIDRVVIAQATQNLAAENATDSFAFVAGKNALLTYSNPNPGLMQPSAGYTFTWQGLFGAGSEGNRISQFRMEHLKATRTEGEMAYAFGKVAADLGTLFLATVA